MATHAEEQVLTFSVDRGPSILDIAAFIGDIGVHSRPRDTWVTIDRQQIALRVRQIHVFDEYPKEGLTIRGSVRDWPGTQHRYRHFEYQVKPFGRQSDVLSVFVGPTCGRFEGYVVPMEGSGYACIKCGAAVPSS